MSSDSPHAAQQLHDPESSVAPAAIRFGSSGVTDGGTVDSRSRTLSTTTHTSSSSTGRRSDPGAIARR